MGHVIVKDPTIHRKFNEIENIFKLAAAVDWVSPAYESNRCMCCMVDDWDDDATNTIITVDFQRYLIEGPTALVNEWWLGNCVECAYGGYFRDDWEDYTYYMFYVDGHWYIIGTGTEYCVEETFP